MPDLLRDDFVLDGCVLNARELLQHDVYYFDFAMIVCLALFSLVGEAAQGRKEDRTLSAAVALASD